MIIRRMEVSDLCAVVAIHKKAFEGFFLTRMGPSFLQAYYQAVLDYEGSIALVVHDGKSDFPSGFAVGFRDPQGFYALFRQRRKRMLPAILRAMVRDPRLAPQILRNVRRVEVQAQQTVDAVELSSIAVGTPGKGVGGALLEAFIEKASSKGARRLILTTDAEGNDFVREFYEARGFCLEGTETRGGRDLCRYSLEL